MKLKRATLAIPFLLAAICTTASAAERWTMVRSQSFIVIGDQSPGTLHDIAERIEKFRAGIGMLIPNTQGPPPMQTVVFVFGTKKAMQPFLPLRKDGKPASLAVLSARRRHELHRAHAGRLRRQPAGRLPRVHASAREQHDAGFANLAE